MNSLYVFVLHLEKEMGARTSVGRKRRKACALLRLLFVLCLFMCVMFHVVCDKLSSYV